MLCCRIFMVFFLMVAVGMSVVSLFFPLFSVTAEGGLPKTQTYYWRNVTSFQYYDMVVYTSNRNTSMTCSSTQLLYTIICCLSTGGIIFGGICLLFAIGHLFIRSSFPLCCIIEILLMLAFLSCCGCIGFAAILFTNNYCSGNFYYYQSPSSLGYRLDTGFIVIVVAAGLFLITSFIECCS